MRTVDADAVVFAIATFTQIKPDEMCVDSSTWYMSILGIYLAMN